MRKYREKYSINGEKASISLYEVLKKKYKIKEIYKEPSIEYILTDYKKFISLISKNTLEYLKDTYKDVTYISTTEIKIGEL